MAAMRYPASIHHKGQTHGQRTEEQQREQEAAGHDTQREKGCKESEEKRKGPYGRVAYKPEVRQRAPGKP